MATELPMEVLDKIFSYLTDPTDVVHARHAHRAFAKAGLRYLTTTIYLSKFNYDLSRLVEISQHPQVAPMIEKLVCDDRNFISVIQQMAGMDSAPHIDGGPPARDEYKKRNPVRLGWYLKMCRQERRMRANGVQMAVLMAALPNLPNLKEVTITDCCGRLTHPGRSAVTRGRIYQTLYHRKNQWTADTPAPQLWGLTRWQRPSDPWDAHTTPFHGLINLIRSLSSTKHAIHTLSIQGRVIGVSHSIFGMAAQDFRHTSNVFANLRTLKLTIDDAPIPWQEDNLANGRMARVLRTAPLLECLEMSFIGIDDDEEPLGDWSSGREFDIARDLGSFTWPHLRHFALINCNVQTHYGLASFLGRHSASIRSLRLEMIYFQHTYLGDFFTELRDGGVRLDNDGFHGKWLWDILWEEADVGGLVEFLRGNGPNPGL